MGACGSKDVTVPSPPTKSYQSKKPKPISQQSISSIDRAILDLKNARDRLQRYRQKLEQDDAKLIQKARQAKQAGRTEQALGLLRLRKYKQAQAAACEEQLLNVLQMVETIDSKQNETQVLAAMTTGKDALQKMHEETTVEDVLNLMDSIRQEVEVESEINQLLQGVPALSPSDEEAVEAELLALMELSEDAAKNQAPKPDAGISTTIVSEDLPVAPAVDSPPATATTTPTNSNDADDPIPA